ncbi:hypothetical protein ZWY2020_033624 [Hordeum vulgare]|nr:hypothetical protein ZWY2020_033624 [Hordeum vulgare]
MSSKLPMAPAERMISLRWPVLRYALCICPWSRRLDERVIQSKSFENFTYPYFSMEALLNMTADFPVNLLPRHDNDSRSALLLIHVSSSCPSLLTTCK